MLVPTSKSPTLTSPILHCFRACLLQLCPVAAQGMVIAQCVSFSRASCYSKQPYKPECQMHPPAAADCCHAARQVVGTRAAALK